MSALVKPLIHTTTTINGDADPVNVEAIATMTKVSNDQATGVKEFSHLVFSMLDHGNNPKSVTWKFADDTARDAAYTAVIALASTAV